MRYLIAAVVCVVQVQALSLEMYGEGHVKALDYGLDPTASAQGNAKDFRVLGDLPRAVLEVDASPWPGLQVEMEVEFEHGGTGSAMEIEADEFGEVESEIEKGGEVVLEQMHLTRVWESGLKAKLGKFYVPVGLWNTHPHPMDYVGARAPEYESAIIPGTWASMGMSLGGQWSNLAWEMGVVEGLDATLFSSENWVGSAVQGRFEENSWNAPGFFIALIAKMNQWNYGLSAYGTNALGNRPKDPMDGFAGLGIVAAHVQKSRGPWQGRVGAVWGGLQDADLISARNQNLTRLLNVPRTPVASAALQASAALSYGVWAQDFQEIRPYMHWAYMNSMWDAEHTVAQPRAEKHELGLGLAWVWHEKLRLAGQWDHRQYPSGQNAQNTWTLGMAYQFAFEIPLERNP
jgi:hypothetical protein